MASFSLLPVSSYWTTTQPIDESGAHDIHHAKHQCKIQAFGGCIPGKWKNQGLSTATQSIAERPNVLLESIHQHNKNITIKNNNMHSLPRPNPSINPYLKIDSSPLCHACFRHLFTLALHSESSFPASWASHPMSATRYAHVLGPALFSAYLAKETEYACPAQERVFYSRTDPPRKPQPCGTFVGRWRETRTGHAAFCVKCEKCAWYTCLRCEETFSTRTVEGSQAAIAHECDPSRDVELEERAFAGLKKGRDWQVFPNERCRRRV